jgi:hypothetical protein
VATTTLCAIRDEMIALVEAINPASLRDVPLRAWRAEQEFPTWAEANPQAAFRRFAIVDSFAGGELPEVINNKAWEDATLACSIAYPDRPSLYGAAQQRSMRDVMREDRDRVVDRIGDAGYGNYAVDCAVNYLDGADDVTRIGSVYLMTLSFRARYYRDVSLGA